MTDVVFYLKAAPSNADKALPWPNDTKLIALDPVALGMGCGGADAYCSTAFSNAYSYFKSGGGGSAIAGLLAHYCKGLKVDRIAFFGFSAAHGFLNPLMNNDVDRQATSALVLLDACFGGGKTGYQKALVDAAAGKLLYATTTSNSGSAWNLNTDLTSGTICFVNDVLKPTGLQPKEVAVRAPMPPPSGGAFQIGSLGFWLQYADASGATELHHYDMGKVQNPMLAAYLVPYWSGQIGGFPWAPIAGLATALAGIYYARKIYKRR